MSTYRIWVLIKKTVRLGPQNPILVFALIIPVLYTVIFQVLFGDLLKEKPVIAVNEAGTARITEELRRNSAVDTILVGSRSAMIDALKENRADIGLTVPADLAEHLESAGMVSWRLFIIAADPAAAEKLLDALDDGRADIGVIVPPGQEATGEEDRVTAKVFILDDGDVDVSELLESLDETATDAAAIVDRETLKEARRRRPEEMSLTLYVNGESLAKDRTIASASVVGALRSLSPEQPDVEFRQVRLGAGESTTLLERFLPFIVLIAVLFGAFLLPATFLVQEKERRTLTALLVTPVSLAEVLTAFALLGVTLAVLMGLAVLVLNVGLTQPILLLVPLVLGSLLMTEWGLTAGLLVKDMNSLLANVKLFGLLFYAPAIVLLFPNWPQWIARLFPTYYIVNPVFRISIFGEGWSEIDWQIYVLAGFVALFLIPLVLVTRRAARRFR